MSGMEKVRLHLSGVSEERKEELTIRVATGEDAPALLKIYSYYVQNTAITFEYEVPSTEEFERRITQTLERYPYLVAEYQGQIVGYAYAGPFKTRAAYAWNVELSIYVEKEQKRRGIGRALYSTLEKLIGEHTENQAPVKPFESAGFLTF